MSDARVFCLLPIGSNDICFIKEPDQLQSEEYFRIDAGSPHGSIVLDHQFLDEREIKPFLKAAVEVVLRDQIFERKVLLEWPEVALLDAHHGAAASSAKKPRDSNTTGSATAAASSHLILENKNVFLNSLRRF